VWFLTHSGLGISYGASTASVYAACAASTHVVHVQHYRITAQDLEHHLGIRSFETHLVRWRLRWLGHVRRMPWDRLPRKLLTAWRFSVPYATPVAPPPPAQRARGATTDRHLEVVGAEPPRSSPIRPPPGGLEAGWEVLAAP
jgi:hypothetical protein